MSFETKGCDDGCEVEAIDHYSGEDLLDQDCIDEVVENDSYCCEVAWDGICQEAYDECSDEDGEGSDECEDALDPYTGQKNKDSDCVSYVQSMDPYCCEVEWDWICQYEYEECVYGAAPESDLSLVNTVKLHRKDGKNILSYRAVFATSTLHMEIVDMSGNILYKLSDLTRKGSVELENIPPSGVVYVRLIDREETLTKELIIE